MATAKSVVVKTPVESFPVDVPFHAELRDADTIDDVISIAVDPDVPGGLNATDPVIDPITHSKVQVTVSGGLTGDRYLLHVVVQTANGFTLERCGAVDVVSCV